MPKNYGLDHYVVATDWNDVAEETEQLLELPHPIPQKPEISPSFFESHSIRIEDPDSEGRGLMNIKNNKAIFLNNQ